MKKLLKIVLYSLLSFVVLLIIAIIVLPRVIDPNDYKPQMVALVKKHTGRDLAINGDIKLSVFPWLGFDIGAMQLSSAATFKDQRFVAIEHAKAQIRLLSLFTDELQIGELELLGLQVTLQTSAAGKNNWDELVTPAPAQPAGAPAPATATKPAKKIRVEHIRVNDASLRWDNQVSHQQVEFSHIMLQAGPFSQDHLPLQLSLGFALPQAPLHGQLQLATAIDMDLAKQHYVLSDLQLQVDASGKALPVTPLHTQLTIPTLIVDTQQQHVQAKAFSLQVGDLHSHGQLELTQFAKPQIRFGLDIAALDLDAFFPAATKDPAAAPAAASPTASATPTPTLPAALDVQGTITINTLKFRQYQASKLNLPVRINDSRVRLQPALQLYEGELRGDWQLNTQAQPLRWQLHNELRGIALGTLVQAIINKELISAKAEVVADLTTQGLDPDSLLQHLNGEARVRLDKTQLVNLDLRNWLLGHLYDQLKIPRATAENPDRTIFDTFHASLTINNGVMTNRDLLAATAKEQLTGSGQVNLIAQTIDYVLNYTRKTRFEFTVGESKYDLKDEPIPIPIRGAWAKLPAPKPDFLAIVKRLQQRALENKKAAVKEKVEKKLETEVKDKLKKFLNR
jgi:AsmA protein